MIKKEIYPKTKRVSCSGDKVYVTEKLDGSNLVFFKKNDELYFAQRKTIININELKEVKDKLYKGLYQWLLDNKDYLQEQLINDSAICGEWLGMGKLKYDVGEFDKRWYMFAKANIDDEYNLYNLIYDHELFKYPFANQEIPNFIGIVPEITELMVLPTKEFLDSIYETYTNGVKRDVEGFVVNYKNIISKYVRMKNGKLEEHFDRGE
jgi:hypothetical protein